MLLGLALLLGAAAPAAAAIAHVQTVTCQASAASSCTTAAITSTTGNLFVAAVAGYDSSFTSVTDSKSNSYSITAAERQIGVTLLGNILFGWLCDGDASQEQEKA